jgi:hypothetical protein
MITSHTRTRVLTATVGAAIATIAAPVLLVLGAATAQATPDISTRGPAGTIAPLPTPRMCPSCDGFNPTQDQPSDPDPGSKVGLGGPDTKVGLAPSLNPGAAAGIVIEGS